MTKLRTLGQLRNRSVARSLDVCNKAKVRSGIIGLHLI